MRRLTSHSLQAATRLRQAHSLAALPTAAHRLRWTALLAAAVAAAAASRPQAEAESREHHAAPTAAQLAELHAFLRKHGALLHSVSVAPVGEAGLGLVASAAAPPAWSRFLRPGWWLSWPGPTLADFPLRGVLVPRTAAASSEPLARAVLDGSCSEREAVILFLLVERARGAASPLHAYLAVLPAAPPTPLGWAAAELAELAGTPLAEALAAQRRDLKAAWARLAPLARRMLAAHRCGAEVGEAQFLNAFATFWSRVLAFPDVQADVPVGHPVPFVEGLVPGLDFANHAAGAPCRWTLLGPRAGPAAPGPPASMALAAGGGRAWPRRGAEVLISYGEGRSNEELLFTYGFATPDNAADALLVAPPLPAGPPAEWDAPVLARLALLHAQGLPPRAFLPVAALASRRQATAAVEAALHVLLPFALAETELAGALEAASPCTGDAPAMPRGAARRSALMLLQGVLQQRARALRATGTAAEDAARQGQPLEARPRAALLYRQPLKTAADGYLALVTSMLAAELAVS